LLVGVQTGRNVILELNQKFGGVHRSLLCVASAGDPRAVQGRRLDRSLRLPDGDAASLYARKIRFIRVCQPGPWDRNHPRTSASTRNEIDSFTGCAFNPCRTIPRTMCAGSASG
jgi:hypothetical protein